MLKELKSYGRGYEVFWRNSGGPIHIISSCQVDDESSSGVENVDYYSLCNNDSAADRSSDIRSGSLDDAIKEGRTICPVCEERAQKK